MNSAEPSRSFASETANPPQRAQNARRGPRDLAGKTLLRPIVFGTRRAAISPQRAKNARWGPRVDLGRRALSLACAAFFVSRNGLLRIISFANERLDSESDREGRREDLDPYGTVETRVPRTVDLTHTTGAQRSNDLVRAKRGAGREGHGNGRIISRCRARASEDSSVNTCAILDADASRRAALLVRFHTPGMRAPRALPGGRLDAHNDTPIHRRILSARLAAI
jgi:hypothetical protein